MSADPAPARSGWATTRSWIGATVGGLLGAAPHVLHHIGLIAGSALITGTGGNIAFFALGVLLSVPMLRRLHRKFGTWAAPAVALGVFTGLFLFSSLVLGPAISDNQAVDETPGRTPTPTDHAGHHS